MSETIDVTDYDALSIVILEAMLKAAGRTDLTEKFGLKSGDAEIEVRVNGVVVPFIKAFEEAWGRMKAVQDEEIMDAAVSLIHQSKLSELLSTLNNAEYEIRQALEASVLNRS